MVGLLEFGVVGRLEFGVTGLLERDPERKSGKRCGETVRLSDLQPSNTIRIMMEELKTLQFNNQVSNYHIIQHEHKPNSFLGIVAVKENTPGRWDVRGEGDGERPLLQEI